MLDVQHIDSKYAFLDGLSDSLLSLVVPVDMSVPLQERVINVVKWRESLLRGELPPKNLSWPPPSSLEPLLQSLQELGITRFTKGNEELSDLVLESMLQIYQESESVLQSKIAERLAELEALERVELEKNSNRQRKRNKKMRSIQQSYDTLRKEAQQWAEGERGKHAATMFVESWEPRVRLWSSLQELFGDLADVLGLGWDLSQGVLQHTSWTDMIRLQQMMEKAKPLKDIIRTLGRWHIPEDGLRVVEEVMEQLSRVMEEFTSRRVPNIPSEARGLVRSDELTRMLPSEATLLLHPTLRMLWHARRAERGLLTYRLEGMEWVVSEQETLEDAANTKETIRPERGPILVCLDTSGSMSGLPETIAKALTLEAMRVAHREGRQCYLYAFSGPEQVLEYELSLSPDGLTSLLSFLSMSFHGGTDVDAPMLRAMERLEQETWKRADVLMVSDGEFDVPASVVQRVEEARQEHQVRMQGIQIGNKGWTGLEALCDSVHTVTEWEAFREE